MNYVELPYSEDLSKFMNNLVDIYIRESKLNNLEVALMVSNIFANPVAVKVGDLIADEAENNTVVQEQKVFRIPTSLINLIESILSLALEKNGLAIAPSVLHVQKLIKQSQSQ